MLPDSIIEDTGVQLHTASRRFRLITLLTMLVAAGISIRAFSLQIMHGSSYRDRAESNRVEKILITAPRGIVYDHYDIALTENISSTDIVINPSLLASQEQEGDLIERLERMPLELSPQEIIETITRAREQKRPVLLQRAITHDMLLQIEEQKDHLPGIQLLSTLVRQYPYSHIASHILGYTAPTSQEELDQDATLSPTDTTGKQGIEQIYDKALRGTPGYTFLEVDAANRPQADLGTQDPIPGSNLQTTIDIELQKFIYSSLAEHAPLRGAVVALDPRDGAVRALVSFPSFDQNAFSQPGLHADTTSLFQDEEKPLFNRATAGTYPSGSVIKPFLAAAGLEENIITPQTIINSTGGISVGPWHFADWKAGGHGVTDVKKAIAESVNTFFYLLIGGDSTHEGLGVAKANAYLHQFGWAQKTGIDLPAESAGFLPTPEWKEETFGEEWYIGDTYHFGIGQGNVLVTPLQVARATAAIATGGYLPNPHIKEQKTETSKITISPQHMQTIAQAMRAVVTEGSGRSLLTVPIALAGKTGTAQIGGTENTHAWFTSFGPYEHPELVLTVLLEEGGGGETNAVPIAKDIWNWWAENRL